MSSRRQKFLSYYKPYLRLLSQDLLCASLVSVIVLILPLCARSITDGITTLESGEALSHIVALSSLMLFFVLIHGLCLFFIDYKGHLMGAYMEHDLRNELFTHLQKMSFSFYDEHKVAHLMTRISGDTNNLAELYHHGPEDIVITSIRFIGTFFILANINLNLTLVIFACLPPMVAYAFHFNKKMNLTLRAVRDRIGDINANIENALSGHRVTSSFTAETFEAQKFDGENQRFLEARRTAYKSEAFLYCGITAFTQLFTIVVIGVGSTLILQGPLSIADLITFLLYVGLLVDPIRTALNFSRLYQNGITGFDRVMELFEQQPEIINAAAPLILGRSNGEVTFDNVSFAYHKQTKPVLKDLSLTIRAGEFVAIVGESGIGKSTLCALIPRFYEIDAGSIFIDQHDIKHLSIASLRQQIAVVEQDVYLFDGTIAENIAYGRHGATPIEIMTAAKQAYADKFIAELPDAYETQVGQRGVKLSGGQKQRISIARAFLKKPSILIFDEATSALDNESELAIKQSLSTLSEDRTTIVIAHRLSTVQHASRILLLGEEGITEQGNHKMLLEKNGRYAKLFKSQASIGDRV